MCTEIPVYECASGSEKLYFKEQSDDKGHAVTPSPPHLATHLVHHFEAWVAASPSKLLGLFHMPVTENLTQFGF